MLPNFGSSSPSVKTEDQLGVTKLYRCKAKHYKARVSGQQSYNKDYSSVEEMKVNRTLILS